MGKDKPDSSISHSQHQHPYLYHSREDFRQAGDRVHSWSRVDKTRALVFIHFCLRAGGAKKEAGQPEDSSLTRKFRP
jgi:hypothetical protein